MSVDGREILKFVQTSLRSQEAALMSVERILDRMPGVFVLFTSDLRFLRINDLGCSVLGVVENQIVGKSLKEVFNSSIIGAISTLIGTLNSENTKVSRTVEVTLAGRDGSSRGMFSMRISAVEGVGKENRFYALVATDLSEIVALRTQIRALFSEINGAVVVLNPKSNVDSPNFDAIEHFLGVSLANLKSPSEVWGSLSTIDMDATEAEAWRKVPSALSGTISEFEKLKDLIPEKVWLKHLKSGEHKCFKINFTLIGAGVVDRAVVFFQDVTASEIQELEKLRLEEALKVGRERQRQADSLNDNVLETVEREFSSLNAKMLKFLEALDADGLTRVLHSYKGNSRCMAFSRLADQVQAVELELNKAKANGILDWEIIQRGIHDINQEWIALHALLMKRLDSISTSSKDTLPAELFGTLNSLFDSAGKELALEDLMMKFALMNETKSTELAAIAKMQAKDVRARLNKNCEFSVKVDTFEVDRKIFQILNEAIVHIVSNAIKHGIEDADTRLALKKPPGGFVRCSIRTQDAGVLMTVGDDGGGINTEKLKLKALQRGVYTADQLSRMSEDEINMLIFHSGISTADEVSMVAGLGVGLHAVMESVRDVCGNIKVNSKIGKGTQFELWLPRHSIQINRRFQSLAPFLADLASAFPKSLTLKLGDQLRDAGANNYFSSYDTLKCVFALARIYSRIAGNSAKLPSLSVKIGGESANTVEVFIDLSNEKSNDFQVWLKSKEGGYVVETVRLMGGSLKTSKNQVVVSLMKCIERDKIPTVFMNENKVFPERKRSAIRLISELLRNDGISVALDEKEVPSFYIEVGQDLLESLLMDPINVNAAKEKVLNELPKMALLSI